MFPWVDGLWATKSEDVWLTVYLLYRTTIRLAKLGLVWIGLAFHVIGEVGYTVKW